jgi:hypothetical protein
MVMVPWWRYQHVSPTRYYLSTKLHGITSHQTVMFIPTAFWTSNSVTCGSVSYVPAALLEPVLEVNMIPVAVRLCPAPLSSVASTVLLHTQTQTVPAICSNSGGFSQFPVARQELRCLYMQTGNYHCSAQQHLCGRVVENVVLKQWRAFYPLHSGCFI